MEVWRGAGENGQEWLKNKKEGGMGIKRGGVSDAAARGLRFCFNPSVTHFGLGHGPNTDTHFETQSLACKHSEVL